MNVPHRGRGRYAMTPICWAAINYVACCCCRRAQAREEMQVGQFVPATGFACESSEPEVWSFY